MADDDARYHCSYCGCDITLRLKCNTCTDLDLCLPCFAAGASAGGHRADHPYQLIDEGSFPLLTEDWGAIEEVLLLDAVEQDGFGNWEDIAAHVVTKTAREAKDHYNEIYVNGVIGRGLIDGEHHSQALSNVGGEVPPSPPSFTPVKLEHSEQLELSYMPLRDDFDREFDDEAEKIISSISVYHDDEDIEKDLKLAHVDMYVRRLREREKRKSIARRHSLIGGRQRLSAHKRKFSKEEREIRAKFKSLARLVEAEEYERFIASMKKERDLKQKIQDLIRYRKNGITKMEDCVELDMLKQEQERLKDDKKENRADASNDSTSFQLLDKEGHLAPGLTLLSLSERKFCTTYSLNPLDYVCAKTEVLKAASLRKNGVAAKPTFPKSFNHDAKCKVLKFFANSGWIS